MHCCLKELSSYISSNVQSAVAKKCVKCTTQKVPSQLYTAHYYFKASTNDLISAEMKQEKLTSIAELNRCFQKSTTLICVTYWESTRTKVSESSPTVFILQTKLNAFNTIIMIYVKNCGQPTRLQDSTHRKLK